MKKTSLAAIMVAMIATPALAQYNAIQHNLISGGFDTTFDGTTIDINASDSDLVTLLDPIALVGTVSNTVFSLTSDFQGVVLDGGVPKAQFAGGSLSLTFDFDDGGGAQPYEISGPITGLLFGAPEQTGGAPLDPGPFIYKIDGVGRWTAAVKNLPGSGNWPTSPSGFSSLDTLTLNFFQDLTAGFDWNTDTLDNGQTQYQITPDDTAVPEPATLALLSLGALGLIRRRR